MRTPEFAMCSKILLWHAVLPLAVLAAAVLPRPAAAQDGFLFRSPITGITVRGGPLLYTAGGDLFSEMRDRLTLDRNDFRTAMYGADVVIMPTTRLDVVLGLQYSLVERDSEYNDWTYWDPVAEEEVGIKQTTRLRAIPLTLSLRYQLVPRARRISDIAWIPNRLAPYIGAGGGIVFHELRQEGEFIDESVDPPPIFFDQLRTTGQGLTLHALAGLDYWFAPRFGLNVEARYTRASVTPNDAYQNYDSLDLSGVQASLGLSIRW